MRESSTIVKRSEASWRSSNKSKNRSMSVNGSLSPRTGCLSLEPVIAEHRARPLKAKVEAAKLQVTGLVRCVHFVNREVLVLLVRSFDQRGQEHRRSLCRGALFGYPTDALLG